MKGKGVAICTASEKYYLPQGTPPDTMWGTFWKKCEIGIQNSRIPKELWDNISTEEELEEALADASVEKNNDLNNIYIKYEPSEEQQNQAVDNAVDLTTHYESDSWSK